VTFRAGGVSGYLGAAFGISNVQLSHTRQFVEGWVIGMATQGPVDIVELAQHNDAFRREIITGEFSQVAPNQLIFVHAGTRHNFLNTGQVPLRLVTVYAPPEHPPGIIHQTKEEAAAAEHH
jgi:hypothetical protein